MPVGKSLNDSELVIEAKKGLYRRTRFFAPDAALTAIEDLKRWVADELSFEEGAATSFGRLLNDLWHCEYLDQLPPLMNRFERLVCAYHVRRGSVPAFHGFCNAWREGVLRRILLFAEEGLELNDPGLPPVPYALLVAGSLGRREQTLDSANRYLLLWGEGDIGYFEPFSYRILAIAEQCSLVGKVGPADMARVLWRGSLADWDRALAGPSNGEEVAQRFELLADARYLCGDEGIAREACGIARRHAKRFGEGWGAAVACDLARSRPFGFFGSLRLERHGDHAGLFHLFRFGVTPLVHGIGLLALEHGLEPASTLQRLALLDEAGALEKGFAQRLASAYHYLAGLKIGKEIVLEQPYLDLRSMQPAERRDLKGALRSVAELQRFIAKKQKGAELEKA